MDIEAAFPAHGQTAELMQQAEGLLDDVAQPAEALDVLTATMRDDRLRTALPAGLTERVAVVTLISQQHREATSRPPRSPGNGRYGVEQIDGLAAVGHVRLGSEHVHRGAVPIADQVVPATGLTAVDRRWTLCRDPPVFASM